MNSLVTRSLLFLCLAMNGCAEYASIESDPPGAQVHLNGKRAGTTPMYHRVSRGDIRSIKYKLEKEDYEPVEGTLETRVAPGRVVGAVFTLGIVYIFRSPLYIQSLYEELVPLPVYAEQTNDSRDRLRRLDDLRSSDLINEAEYQKLRAEILDGL